MLDRRETVPAAFVLALLAGAAGAGFLAGEALADGCGYNALHPPYPGVPSGSMGPQAQTRAHRGRSDLTARPFLRRLLERRRRREAVNFRPPPWARVVALNAPTPRLHMTMSRPQIAKPVAPMPIRH